MSLSKNKTPKRNGLSQEEFDRRVEEAIKELEKGYKTFPPKKSNPPELFTPEGKKYKDIFKDIKPPKWI